MSRYIKKKKLQSLIEPHILNNLKGDQFELKNVISSNLLTWNRLDIAFKLLYLEYNNKSQFAKKFYSQHVKAFTLGSFQEYGNLNKNSIKKYIDSFEETFNNLKNNGFIKEKSLIPISNDNSILNGSHRIASAIFLNKKVDCVYLNLHNQIYDYNFFTKRHLSDDILDIAVSKFIEYSNNTYIAFIWPSAQGFDEKVGEIIPNIIYRKDVNLNKTGAHNLLSQIYFEENWIGDINNNFIGTKGKLVKCFKTFNPIRVIAFQEESLDKVLVIKDRIRKIFNIGKHSIHITDTKKETVEASRIIFNKNSIHFLNFSNPNKYKSTHNKIAKFKSFLNKHKIDSNKVIIDSSLVLSAYGIREANDIDFLMDNSFQFNNDNSLINIHDDDLKWHKKTKNDLIYNPSNYFYFNEIKFLSFSLLYDMKKRRGEVKDKNDCKMMDALIHKNRAKKIVSKFNQEFFYFKAKSKSKIMKISEFFGVYKIVRWFYRLLLKSE
tara:strand:+ start:8527 stop:9999 length:1473 start_codon:yes stop_codon:yes gene_type:complete